MERSTDNPVNQRSAEHCLTFFFGMDTEPPRAGIKAMTRDSEEAAAMPVPTEMMRRSERTRVATGGAQRNYAMKSNRTKGSPLAVPELSQKSVTEQKTESPQAVPREVM